MHTRASFSAQNDAPSGVSESPASARIIRNVFGGARDAKVTSRAGSAGSLWSSADVPLYLDRCDERSYSSSSANRCRSDPYLSHDAHLDATQQRRGSRARRNSNASMLEELIENEARSNWRSRSRAGSSASGWVITVDAENSRALRKSSYDAHSGSAQAFPASISSSPSSSILCRRDFSQSSSSQRKRPAPLKLDQMTSIVHGNTFPASVSTVSNFDAAPTPRVADCATLTSSETYNEGEPPTKAQLLDPAIISSGDAFHEARITIDENIYSKAKHFFDSSYSMEMRSQLALHTLARPELLVAPDELTECHSRFSMESDDVDSNDLSDDIQWPESSSRQSQCLRPHASNISFESSLTSPDTTTLCRIGKHIGSLALSDTVDSIPSSERHDLPLTPPHTANNSALLTPKNSKERVPRASSFSSTQRVRERGPQRRPTTTSALVTPAASPSKMRLYHHAHATSDQEVLRRMKTSSEDDPDRLSFLQDNSARFNQRTPTSPRSPMSPRFLRSPHLPERINEGIPMGTFTSPRFGQFDQLDATTRRLVSMSVTPDNSTCSVATTQTDSIRAYSDDALSKQGTKSGRGHGAALLFQKLSQSIGTDKLRRPSLPTEVLAATTHALRCPNRPDDQSLLSHQISEAGQSPFSGTAQGTESRIRLASTASGYSHSGTRSITPSSEHCHTHRNLSLERAQTTSTGKSSKSKATWSAHLSHGLVLHIDRGNNRSAWHMRYSRYDPFGRSESLCAAKGRLGLRQRASLGFLSGRSRSSAANAYAIADSLSGTEQMGILEFEAEEGHASTSTTSGFPLPLTAHVHGHNPPLVLKHLTVGRDSVDLMTKQAPPLSPELGTHVISGSERAGKVAWRFQYSVEELLCTGQDRSFDDRSHISESEKSVPSSQVFASARIVRPIRFWCSTTLFDPARARKAPTVDSFKNHVGPSAESPLSAVGQLAGRQPSILTSENASSLEDQIFRRDSRRFGTLFPGDSDPLRKYGARSASLSGHVPLPQVPIEQTLPRRCEGASGLGRSHTTGNRSQIRYRGSPGVQAAGEVCSHEHQAVAAHHRGADHEKAKQEHIASLRRPTASEAVKLAYMSSHRRDQDSEVGTAPMSSDEAGFSRRQSEQSHAGGSSSTTRTPSPYVGYRHAEPVSPLRSRRYGVVALTQQDIGLQAGPHQGPFWI